TGPAIGADSGWADSARGRYASRPGQLRQPPKNWSRSDTPLAGKYPNATTDRRGHVEEDAPRVGFRRVASALDDVDGEAAERCLLVLRGHIRAGLAHPLDHLVEVDSMLAVAPQRHPRGVDGLARRDRIAFDAGDLRVPGDRVAGQAQVVFHRSEERRVGKYWNSIL